GGVAEVIRKFIDRRIAEIDIQVTGAIGAGLHGRRVLGSVAVGLEHLRLGRSAPVEAPLPALAVLGAVVVVIVIIIEIWIAGLPLLNRRSDLTALLQRLAIRVH